MKIIGEVLIYLVSLPIFAFQTVEGIQALVEAFASISEYTGK